MCTRCEELQEEVRQLRVLLAPPSFDVPTCWKLTAAEELAFLSMHGRLGNRCSVERIFEATRQSGRGCRAYSEVADPVKLVAVYICLLRSKLRRARAPFAIRTAHGRGYILERIQ